MSELAQNSVSTTNSVSIGGQSIKSVPNITSNGIGALESQIHRLYFGLRVPGEDFVYSNTNDAFNILEDYCSVQNTDSVSSNGYDKRNSPLLIVGEAGSGKSALLANWMLKRQRVLARSRMGGGEEFIFYHAVGCSRQSLSVSCLLRRLITEIKEKFEITREVPASQEKLRWELPRFLDHAAKRARVIVIVIDGLHRLFPSSHFDDSNEKVAEDDQANKHDDDPFMDRNDTNETGSDDDDYEDDRQTEKDQDDDPKKVIMRNLEKKAANGGKSANSQYSFYYDDSNEGSLSWLPLEFAPNIRVILSATLSPAEIDNLGAEPKSNGKTTHGVEEEVKNIVTEIASGDQAAAAGASTSGMNTSSNAANTNSVSNNGNSSTPASNSNPSNANSNSSSSSNNNISNGGNASVVSEASSRKHRIIQEIERRNWNVMKLKYLDRAQCKSLTEAYIHKSVHSDAALQTAKPFFNSSSSPTKDSTFYLTSTLNEALEDSQGIPNYSHLASELHDTPGFLLFDTQINALLTHSCGNNPLFLRLFLRSAHFAVKRGYSLWRIWDDWLKADSIISLLNLVLKTFERGFARTDESAQVDCERTLSSGGLPALKLLYPWHPFFQTKTNDCSDTLVALDFRNSIEEDNLAASVGTGNEIAQGHLSDVNGKGVLSSSVLQSLGDQKWLAVSEQAESMLEEARIHSERNLEDILEQIGKRSRDSGMSFIESILRHVDDKKKEEHGDISTSIPEKRVISVDFSGNEVDGDDEEEEELDEDENDSDIKNNEKDCVDESDTDGISGLNHTNSSNIDNHDKLFEGSEDALKEETDELKPLPQPSHDTSPHKPDDHSSSRRGSVSHKGKGLRVRVNSGLKIGVDDGSGMDGLPRSSSMSKLKSQVDPAEDFEKLPLYLRGGSGANGFGYLLGDALSFLYVARHGLKESELWSMLATLNKQRLSEIEINSMSDKNKNFELSTKNFLSLICTARGNLEDLCRSYDGTHQGMISRGQFVKCICKIHPALKRADIIEILYFLGIFHSTDIENEGRGTQINEWNREKTIFDCVYMEDIGRMVKMQRNFKLQSFRSRNHQNENESTSSLDDFDHLSVPNEGSKGNVNMGVNNIKAQDLENGSLGPLMEESLLSVLCALGALHSPENQVLILPCDGAVIRQVIRLKYVEGRASHEVWHSYMIKFFKRESNTMRRCEELPWHLQLCKKWQGLRDTLGDLDTFDMMYTGDLRDELMSYWVLLTEGPLYTSYAAQKGGFVPNHHDPASEAARILIEIDTAAILGLSDRESKKQLLKNQIAPFDIVEELNKSIEYWISTSKPPSQRIHYMIMLISRFLVEYSKNAMAPPPFLRIGIDLKGLRMFGINFDDDEFLSSVLTMSDMGKNKISSIFPTDAMVKLISFFYFSD